MSCSEDTIVLIPFQRILTKISHRLSQIRDVGGVSGDIGGIRRHGIVGGFQLRAVNGIGAASRQVAIFNVGDFAGGLGAMSCREYTIVLIPFQRILTKISHRLSQVRDVGGVSGNIGSVIGPHPAPAAVQSPDAFAVAVANQCCLPLPDATP